MDGVHIFEGVGTAVSLLAKHFASAGVEALVLAFTLIIPGPPLLSATDEFADKASAVHDRLVELGLAQRSLFLGAGIDEESSGCELLLTNVFTDIDTARSAGQAQQRPHWGPRPLGCRCAGVRCRVQRHRVRRGVDLVLPQ
jgi:hypothetical protein